MKSMCAFNINSSPYLSFVEGAAGAAAGGLRRRSRPVRAASGAYPGRAPGAGVHALDWQCHWHCALAHSRQQTHATTLLLPCWGQEGMTHLGCATAPQAR